MFTAGLITTTDAKITLESIKYDASSCSTNKQPI